MSDLEQLYQQVILDHSRLRAGSGSLPEDLDGSSHQVNPTCGDEVTLGVNLKDNGEIDKVIWDGSGCSISQASLSIMCELIEGKSREEIEALAADFDQMMHSRGREIDEEILDRLEDGAALHGTSQFANRVKCALLGWMALRDALAHADAEKEAK